VSREVVRRRARRRVEGGMVRGKGGWGFVKSWVGFC